MFWDLMLFTPPQKSCASIVNSFIIFHEVDKCTVICLNRIRISTVKIYDGITYIVNLYCIKQLEFFYIVILDLSWSKLRNVSGHV